MKNTALRPFRELLDRLVENVASGLGRDRRSAFSPTQDIAAGEKDVPEPQVYITTQDRKSVSHRPRPTIQPRHARIAAYSFLRFGVPLIAFLSFFLVLSPLPLIVAGAWLFLGTYPSWWLSRFLPSLVVSSFHCPHCHQDYEATARWSCSCGFTDHRERHILRFRCRKCLCILGYFDCVRCNSTIIL